MAIRTPPAEFSPTDLGNMSAIIAVGWAAQRNLTTMTEEEMDRMALTAVNFAVAVALAVKTLYPVGTTQPTS